MKLFVTLVKAVLVCSALIVINVSVLAQNRTSPVAVGELAPDFTLESHQGTKVMLSAARGKSPVVLVFYRGYW